MPNIPQMSYGSFQQIICNACEVASAASDLRDALLGLPPGRYLWGETEDPFGCSCPVGAARVDGTEEARAVMQAFDVFVRHHYGVPGPAFEVVPDA